MSTRALAWLRPRSGPRGHDRPGAHEPVPPPILMPAKEFADLWRAAAAAPPPPTDRPARLHFSCNPRVGMLVF